MVSKLVTKLKRLWVYPLIVAMATFATWQVVSAAPSDTSVDTCEDLIYNCRVVESHSPHAKQDFSPAQVLASTDYSKYITYRIVFEGNLAASTDTENFIAQVAQTLAHPQGWIRAGYIFNRVQVANQADFSLTLIQAELLDQIPGCDSNWSCRSGRNVYINEDRWNSATSAWNNAGGSLRDYRHLVVNHEVGHWLGHGHYNCSDSPSTKAPVMQQQSIDLQGCDFNPWPLAFEIEAV